VISLVFGKLEVREALIVRALHHPPNYAFNSMTREIYGMSLQWVDFMRMMKNEERMVQQVIMNLDGGRAFNKLPQPQEDHSTPYQDWYFDLAFHYWFFKILRLAPPHATTRGTQCHHYHPEDDVSSSTCRQTTLEVQSWLDTIEKEALIDQLQAGQEGLEEGVVDA
jgi:ATP-dependent exoDNAse (exonuclease V) beta subunit